MTESEVWLRAVTAIVSQQPQYLSSAYEKADKIVAEYKRRYPVSPTEQEIQRLSKL